MEFLKILVAHKTCLAEGHYSSNICNDDDRYNSDSFKDRNTGKTWKRHFVRVSVVERVMGWWYSYEVD